MRHLIFLSLLALMSQPYSVHGDMSEYLINLRLEDTEATARTLLAVGVGAIPSLAEALSSNRHFKGVLGGAQTESSYVIEREFVDGDSHKSLESQHYRQTTVGEAAAYLIMAILDDNLYHHGGCTLELFERSDQEGEKIQSLLAVIQQELLDLENFEMSARDFQEILRMHGLRFSDE